MWPFARVASMRAVRPKRAYSLLLPERVSSPQSTLRVRKTMDYYQPIV